MCTHSVTMSSPLLWYIILLSSAIQSTLLACCKHAVRHIYTYCTLEVGRPQICISYSLVQIQIAQWAAQSYTSLCTNAALLRKLL